MNLDERATRATPFYHSYWDHVPTQSEHDPTVGTRNVVIEAMVDLLCFAKLNNVDSDIVLAQVQKLFLDLKLESTFGVEETADG